MLKNKYVAIVLAIVAVVVVVYQFFLREPEGSGIKPSTHVQAAGMQPKPAAGMQSRSAAGPAPQVGGTTAPKPGQPVSQDAPEIDYDSPILLQRVYDNPIEPYPRRELPDEYGTPIFTTGETGDPGKPQIEREIQFHLNLIVIDKHRRLTVINGLILAPGDFVSGAEVKRIEKSRVTLSFRQKTIVLSTDSRLHTIKLIGGNVEN